MAGQIIKRSTKDGEPRWLVRWFEGIDGNGKRVYRSKTLKGTKRDAQKYLREQHTSQDAGTYVAPQRITLNAYLDRWLESAKPRLATRTYDDYRRTLDRYVREELGARQLDAIRPLDVQALYAGMLERGIGPRTVRLTHAVLGSALRQAVRWGMLAANPADGARVQLPKHRAAEKRALDPAEVVKFREAARGTTHAILWEFMLTTGCRPGEALGLRWEDLDQEAGTVRIRQALSRTQGQPFELKEPKTKAGKRTIPLPGRVVAGLVEHRREQAAHALKLGPGYRRDLGLVFANLVGEPLEMRNLAQRHLRKIVEAAELRAPKTVTPYTLRHTCASLALQAGVNVRVLAERLGHAKASMTLDVYSHVVAGAQDEATAKLETLLGG